MTRDGEEFHEAFNRCTRAVDPFDKLEGMLREAHGVATSRALAMTLLVMAAERAAVTLESHGESSRDLREAIALARDMK